MITLFFVILFLESGDGTKGEPFGVLIRNVIT